MGTFVLTDEDAEFLSDDYNETGVFVGHPIDWDSNPVEGRVIGVSQSEKYDLGDRIQFDPATLTEVDGGGGE